MSERERERSSSQEKRCLIRELEQNSNLDSIFWISIQRRSEEFFLKPFSDSVQ